MVWRLLMQSYIDRCTPTLWLLEDNIQSFMGFSCSCNGSIMCKASTYYSTTLPHASVVKITQKLRKLFMAT